MVTAIIPARMASSRFPGKPLARVLGMPMLEHVYRRSCMCDSINETIIATCDQEIMTMASEIGAKACMTSDRHESCIDRVSEVAERISSDIVINVQGDMPLVRPETLSSLLKPLIDTPDLLVTDAMGKCANSREFENPNVVKVVVNSKYNALYYSREAIPSARKMDRNVKMFRYKQFGITAFRRSFLLRFAKWPRKELESCESIDMIRSLENEVTVRMVLTPYPAIGVDAPEDIETAERLMMKDPLFPLYKVNW